MIAAFIDSNILLYSVSQQDEDREKQRIARKLLEGESASFTLSVQVLNEFLNIATQPKKHRMSRDEAAHHTRTYRKTYPIVSLDQATHELTMTWYLPKHLSLWDSLIVASANLADCTTLYSEDMNHRQTFGNVTIINPFREE